MMKKISLYLILICFSLICLTGCGSKNEKKEDSINSSLNSTNYENKQEDDTESKEDSSKENEENQSTEQSNNSNNTQSNSSSNQQNNNTQSNSSSNQQSSNTQNNNTSNSGSNKEEKPTCVSKKFNEKYKYVYEDEKTCHKEGESTAFFDITDNVDDRVFTINCDKIVDDCGKTWWGVSYNIYDPSNSTRDDGVVVLHY